MTKIELVDAIAKNGNMTKKAATEALDVVVNTIMTELGNKETIRLVGFGTFSTVEKEAHEARNPKTGEVVKVPAKTVPKFTYSTTFKNSIAQ